MRFYAPPYYQSFVCKAGSCCHSCCVGWEIDIDDETALRYQAMEGGLGDRIRSAIVGGEDGSLCFALDERERCPFLTENGLCEIILAHGEELLSDICALHPRFRNDFADRTEVGLGLCCEEAARIVLTYPHCPIPIPIKQPWRMEVGNAEDDCDTFEEEKDLLALRDALLTDLWKEGGLNRFLAACPEITLEAWEGILRGFDRLDGAWDTLLDRLKGKQSLLGDSSAPRWEAELVRFAAYLITRHLPGACEDGLLEGRLAFCAAAVATVSAFSPDNFAELLDCVRMFSSEIEYDTEHTKFLFRMEAT